MSTRQTITTPSAIKVILFAQFIPLVLFPPESFSTTTQEWWLPALLAVFTFVAVWQILRRSVSVLPWNLISFSQGFNVISRLMMLFPHAIRSDVDQSFNGPYVALSLTAMVISSALLWYFELPEVRLGLLRNGR
jgi:hypothetical protein